MRKKDPLKPLSRVLFRMYACASHEYEVPVCERVSVSSIYQTVFPFFPSQLHQMEKKKTVWCIRLVSERDRPVIDIIISVNVIISLITMSSLLV